MATFGSDGWGTVEDTHGVSFPFHCTAISDGSRTIDVDEAVEFGLHPGRQGRWEAVDVVPAGGLPGDG